MEEVRIEGEPTAFVVLAIYRRVRKELEKLAKGDSSWDEILMMVTSLVFGMEIFGSVLLSSDLDALVEKAEDHFGKDRIEETVKSVVANYASIRNVAEAESILIDFDPRKNLSH